MNAHIGLSCRINEVNYKGIYMLGFQNVAVGRINGVAALTGFSYKKMYGYLAGPKQVAIITR